MKGAQRLAIIGAAIALAIGHGPAQAQGKPHYVIGKPYQFDGVWYEPAVDYSYDRTGIAVVYPPGRSALGTTSGEPYDENAIAGAHKTLPLPCLVRVTNLANGKSITLRLNDRGPFVDNQIVELTPAAAEALGIAKQIPAQVRIQVMAKESQALAASLGAGNDLGPTPANSITPAPTPVVKVTGLPALGETGIQPLKPVAAPSPAAPAAASAVPSAIPLPPQPAPSPVATTTPPAKPSAPASPTTPVATPSPAIAPTAASTGAASISPPPAKITPAVSVNVTNATAPTLSPMAPAPTLIPVQISTAPPTSDPTKVKPLPVDLPAQFFIQTGAFKDQAKAEQLRGKLATLAPAKVVPTRLGADPFNAVLLGPISSMADAQRLLKQVTGMGYADAVLIIE